MFDDYLNDEQSYIRLERYLWDLFFLECDARGVESKNFKAPFYNTAFSDGTPFREGNPIFSARNEVTGKILRIVLDEDAVPLVTYQDKDMGCELVLVGKVALLDEIKKLMRKWIRSQHSGLHVASAVTE
ncbi:hypothetical protein QWI18_18080 [Pseudomonas sp. W2Oct36]|uniref:hypothetical protein n=1 Tax=Pseudomonas sp. W2Oct36 TaxID=1215284 RepID=UPI0034E06B27